MKQRKSSELNILRKKAAAKLTKELEELHTLSAEEIKMRYFENPAPDSGSIEFENNLKKEVESLRTIFDASPISIWNKDTKNNIIRVNKAAAKFVGREINEIEGKSADEIFPLESEKYYKDDLEVISTGNSKIGIIESLTAKGETRWVRTDKIPWYLPTGEIAGIIAFARDITTLKIAEQNLKNSEELFRRVITNAPISIFATDEKGIFTLHEGKAIERLGMKSGENVGASAYDLFSGIKVIEHNGTVSTGKAVLDRVSKGEYLSGITELNGVIFDNQFAPIWDENHKVSGLLGVATDITERKQAEEELRESETYNRMLFDQSVIGLALSRMDGQFADVNLAFAQIIGRTIDEIKNLTYWDITPETFAEQEKIQLDSLNTTGRFGPYEKEYIHKNGKLVPVRLQGVIIERNNQKYIWSNVEDISERKQLEAERLAFEKRYQMLFNEIDEGFCIVEMIFDDNEKPIDYRFLEVNPAFAKQTGLEDALGKSMRELAPEHEGYWFEIYRKIALTGEPARFVNRAEQLHRWYDVYAFRFGQPEKRQVAILFNDISERKRIQDELRVREEKWHNLFEILPVGVSIVNIQNNTLEINDALSEILEISKNELINGAYHNRSYFRSDMTTMPPEEFPSIRVIREKKFVRDVEVGIKKEDGSMIWTNVSAAPMSLIQASVTITTDITKHKQALEKIKESEHNLAEAERIGNTGSWDYEVATDTAVWSENMFRIFDVDPVMNKELVFKHFVENLVHPDDRSHIQLVFQDALAGKCPYDLEYRIIKLDGSIRTIHSLAETLFDKNGKAIRMIGKVEDITERKQAEEKLNIYKKELILLNSELINAQEKERKILAQELHDEVGQSLTAMKINLASIMKKLPVEQDVKTKNRLQEMNEIIEHLISQVHEISLNLRPAMLDVLGLLPTIKSYGNQFSERTGIIVHTENDININFEKEQEIHLYRIVQEAFTNVVKHAHAKNIFLNLTTKGNILILSIQDDGCGFLLNEKESISQIGIGIIGMRERVNSLKGEMKIITSPQKGTKIEIQIPLNQENE